ncbi:MAG TPA: nuclear transport factor 2 family protein [Thermoleophilaceae bacterium]|jgi:hypothetical protein
MLDLAGQAGSSAGSFAERFAAGWAKGGPPERFVAHFGPMCAPDVLMVQPLSPPLHGLDGLRQFADSLFGAIPDLRGEVVRSGPTDDGRLIELTLRGTFGGRLLEWTVVDRIVLRDGLIAERHSYFDPTPLLPALWKSPRAALRLLRGMRQRKENR